MMNEKQIYRRMNEAYESLFRDSIEDEWYGDDDPKIWRFYRPREDTTFLMEMNEEEKKIDISFRNGTKGEYKKYTTYSWR